MAVTMYALVRVSDQTKVTESKETTHLNNGQEAWVPIVYEDQPDISDDEVAERSEGMDGAVWRKSWTVRNKTPEEKKIDRMAAIDADERGIRADLLDVLLALLDDDGPGKINARARIRDVKDRRAAEE